MLTALLSLGSTLGATFGRTFLAAQAEFEFQAELSGTTLFIYVLLIAIVLIGMWKVYTKAGQPGWAVLIPFYNIYVLLKIVGRPGWWILLYFIPIVNLIVAIIVCVELAQSFGKGVGFALGLVFLGPIFWMILGFGSARYKGPAAQSA